MSITFDELPDWRFEVNEVSAGVYSVTGKDSVGRCVGNKGTNLDELLDVCKAMALKIVRQLECGDKSQ